MKERQIGRHRKEEGKHRAQKGGIPVWELIQRNTAEEVQPQKHEIRPVISRRWQAGTIAGNTIIGAAELFTGGGSTLSVTADGLHNAGDAATYYLQTENVLNPNLTKERKARRRKIAHTIIAGLSAGVATKAGYDIVTGEERPYDPLTLYSAGASLALNSLLMATLYRGINRRKKEHGIGPHEHDLTKHLWAIDVPSAAIAVGGSFAHRYGITDVETAGAVASGLLGAYAFRPTSKNLDHDSCAKHGHHAEHEHSHNHKHDPPRDSSQANHHANLLQPRSTWRPMAAVAATAVLAGSLGAASTKKDFEYTESLKPPAVEITLPAIPVPEGQLFTKKTAQAGDSQWGIAKRAIKEVGLNATDASINPVAHYMAYENYETNANPNRMIPGQAMNVPTKEVIQIFDTAKNTPHEMLSAEGLQFKQDIDALNHIPDMNNVDVLKKKASVFKRMKQYLIKKLSPKRYQKEYCVSLPR